MSEWDELPSPQQKERAIAIRPTGTVGWPQGNTPQAPSEWDALPTAKPPAPATGPTADAIATNTHQSDILHAFGQGFMDEWGSAKFGPELKAVLDKYGILYGPSTAAKGEPTAAQAFNEAWLRPLANALDVGLRTATGVGMGLHEASIAAGHPWDSLAAGMEAFPLAGAELGRIGWATTRASLAKTGDTRVDAILDEPGTQRAVSNPVVNDGNDVPYSAGPDKIGDGLNIDRNFPKQFTIDGKTFNPAEPFAVHEFVERDVMQKLTAGGMSNDAAYRVAHYEFAEKAEGAWYAANGIDQAKAEAAYKPYIDKINHENPNNPPPNLYAKPYPHSNVRARETGPVEAMPPSPEEIAQANGILDTGITAYHGSPYAFEAFSNEKIGTGEGAQSYGHGLYFAEHPNTAAVYARIRPGRPINSPVVAIPTDVLAALKSVGYLGFDRPGQALNALRDNIRQGKNFKEGWDLDQPQDAAAVKVIGDYLQKPGPGENRYQVRIWARERRFS